MVSQKNQALRLRLFLSDSEAGRRIRDKIQLSTLVLYLDWGDSTAPIPDEITELSKTLGDAPIQRVTLPSATQVFTRLRFRDFSTIYEKVLADNPDLEKAYLMSYEGHYAVMARILNNHSVTASLARTDGVKKPKSCLLEAVGGEERVGNSLFEGLGISVGPSNFLWCADYSII